MKVSKNSFKNRLLLSILCIQPTPYILKTNGTFSVGAALLEQQKNHTLHKPISITIIDAHSEQHRFLQSCCLWHMGVSFHSYLFKYITKPGGWWLPKNSVMQAMVMIQIIICILVDILIRLLHFLFQALGSIYPTLLVLDGQPSILGTFFAPQQ